MITLIDDPLGILFMSICIFMGIGMAGIATLFCIHIGVVVLSCIVVLFCRGIFIAILAGIVMLSCIVMFSSSDNAILEEKIKRIAANKTPIGISVFKFWSSWLIMDYSSNYYLAQIQNI